MTQRSLQTLKKGKLRIGDQWNAITIIARSQTHVLKAVCEFVENSIDAGAKHIEIIRRKTGGEMALEILDDGKGLKTTDDGLPDFQYVATHICDSLKRYLKSHDREGVHGEFGIGLLGFWSLGKQLTMITQSADGRTFQMTMKSGGQTYSIAAIPGSIGHRGVKVVVGPLHPTTRNILTGDRIDKYLASELRDRIKQSGVVIEIFDRITHKNRRVVPREFEGERLSDLKDIHIEHGTVRVELYLTSPKVDQVPQVSLSKDGTIVKRDIAQFENFDHGVWKSGFFTGNIDCPFIDLTPGTRDSIIHDERFERFCLAMQPLQNAMQVILDSLERAATEKASVQISRDVRKAFASALAELPQTDYLWFDIDVPNGKPGGAPGGMAEGLRGFQKTQPSAIPSFLDVLPGEAARAVTSPKFFSMIQGESHRLHVHVFDDKDIEIKEGISVVWSVLHGGGAIAMHLFETQALYRAPAEPANAVVAADVVCGGWRARAESKIKVLPPEQSERGVSVGQGLPNYRLVVDISGAWRSRYVPLKNIIEINSTHRDFSASKVSFATHRRYIGKLYAKEIVLLNFPGISQNETLERLVEVLVRIEKQL
jgi:Histidine kinase-, DNA gyrase B-, and HSP90-like ATPase